MMGFPPHFPLVHYTGLHSCLQQGVSREVSRQLHDKVVAFPGLCISGQDRQKEQQEGWKEEEDRGSLLESLSQEGVFLTPVETCT